MTNEETIRVVFFCEGEKWVAQCLEYDIGAQASDLDTLQTLFSVVLEAEVQESVQRHGRMFEGIPRAPRRFEEMWTKQSNVFKAAVSCASGVGVELALVA